MYAVVPAYYEADNQQRETGEVWSQTQNTLTGKARTEPFCFLQIADIFGEINSLCRDRKCNESEAAKEVFAKERRCQSWYSYNPGLSPKDHFDQMNTELLERSRREWEVRLETERKDFDLKLFKASQEIQESNRQIAAESYRTARRSFRFTMFSTIVIVCLTLITLFLTLLQVWLAMRQSGNPQPFQEWLHGLGSKLSGG